MKNKLTLLLVVAGLMLLCILPVSCTRTSSDRTLTLVENWDFASGFYPVITAATSNNYGFMAFGCNVYDTLVTYNTDGKIVGKLAENFDKSEDGLRYTFKLRPDVKFSDGTPLTSEAVKQSIEAALVNLGPSAAATGKLFTIIKEIQCPDQQSLILVLKQPYYAALNDLCMQNPMAIVNPKAFEGGMDKALENCKTISMGTGAYMLDRIETNSYSFVRNPHYWGEKPALDGFTVKVIPDNDAKAMALRSGEIDAIIGAERVSFDAFNDLAQETGFGSLVNKNSTSTQYLAMNLAKAPFDDQKVREAVAYALDQQELETSVFNGLQTAAESFCPRNKPFCDVDLSPYPTDLNRAKILLDEAGWLTQEENGVREKNGEKLSFKLVYSQSFSTIDNAMLTIAAQLKKIGMEVEPAGLDMMGWYGAVMSGEYSMAYWFTYGRLYDPFTLMTNINTQDSTDPVMAQFALHLEGGTALIEELNSTTDMGRAQEIYNLVLKTIHEKSLVVPVAYVNELAIWNQNSISGYRFQADTSAVDVSAFQLKK